MAIGSCTSRPEENESDEREIGGGKLPLTGERRR
jgi:hypothetical protein